MDDLISRQAAIDVVKGIDSYFVKYIEDLPSAQPELPKQFMSDDCISRSELYKKVCEAEKLARERVLDTPSDSPFPNKLNPAYTRYSAQLNERTQFKHMIADARSVQPEQRWIPCDKGEPDEDTECWVTVKTTDTLYRGNFTKRYGERRDKGFITSGGFMWWNTALAWMPIYEPEPYNAESEG